MRHLFIGLACVALLALSAAVSGQGQGEDGNNDRVDYLVITADDLAPAARQWADYRAARGRKVRLLTLSDIARKDKPATPESIRDAIVEIAGEKVREGFQVLFVGDAPKDAAKFDPKVEIPWFTTTFKDLQGTLIAGDNFYADIRTGDDDLPEIAVGRIPARRVEDVRLALGKVRAYEAAKYGEWVKRLTFFAGEGGYGALVDGMIEAAFTKFVDKHLDAAYDVRMTYANISSPYAWAPSKFSEKVIAEANTGALLLTYIGHGSHDRLDNFRVKTGPNTFTLYPILTSDDVGKFNIKDGQLPVMTIIACDTGWLDANADNPCLAERIMFTDNAPVAVVASSRNSHPYSNMIVQKGMAQGVVNKKMQTLGDVFLYMKRELLLAAEPDRKELEDMAALLMPKKSDRDAHNRAHLHLYNLAGDPGLRLKHPNIEVSMHDFSSGRLTKDDKPLSSIRLASGSSMTLMLAPSQVLFGEALNEEGQRIGHKETVIVSVEHRRSKLRQPPAAFDAVALTDPDDDKRNQVEKIITSNHAGANNKHLATLYPANTNVGLGAECLWYMDSQHLLKADKDLAPGEYVVKMFALDAKGEYCGFAAIPLTVVKKE